MKQMITDWKKNTSDLIKLQTVFAGAGILMMVVAGLVGLMDRGIAYTLLQVVQFVFIIFAANFVTWAVIQSFVVTKPRNSKK